MDLLKTLLFYMIMTTAGATLEANVTPIPYDQLHTPTPVVTATPTPTPSPTPTVAPTPTAALTVLNVGSRGTNVRILQQKLIDMGYLTGEADGIYGNQTRDAVQAFQQRNNLEADGIAGRMTLDKLYNDPAALPAAGFATPVPVTPTPEPASALVSVQYLMQDGQMLAQAQVKCYAGDNTLWADLAYLPQGYRLTEDVPQTVTVSAQGAASVEVISFYCEPIMGDVTVIYQTQAGEPLLTETHSFLAGTHTISANDALLPAGYTLVSQRLVAFAVNDLGVASPAIITFTYQAPAPTATPTAEPTAVPTVVPTVDPTVVPTAEPTAVPTAVPTTEPTAVPTAVPTTEPTAVPTAVPTAEPTAVPTAVPTAEPTAVPTAVPTIEPTAVPTIVPTAEPLPTATPGVTIEITSELPVEYRLGDTVIAETIIPMPRKDTLIYPDKTLLPVGYELLSMDARSLDADHLPDVVVFEVQEALFLCTVDVLYETVDGLLASERRQISTRENAVMPNPALVLPQFSLISASPVLVPAEDIAAQHVGPIVFRYAQIPLSLTEAFVTVDGKSLPIVFHVDENHNLYLPLKALSSALLLSCNTEEGFFCQWNGHTLDLRCQNGTLVSAEIDGSAIPLNDQILLVCLNDDLFASTAFFQLLGYEISTDKLQLTSIQ